jgi:hypothetical protein
MPSKRAEVVQLVSPDGAGHGAGGGGRSTNIWWTGVAAHPWYFCAPIFTRSRYEARMLESPWGTCPFTGRLCLGGARAQTKAAAYNFFARKFDVTLSHTVLNRVGALLDAAAAAAAAHAHAGAAGCRLRMHC